MQELEREREREKLSEGIRQRCGKCNPPPTSYHSGALCFENLGDGVGFEERDFIRACVFFFCDDRIILNCGSERIACDMIKSIRVVILVWLILSTL